MRTLLVGEFYKCVFEYIVKLENYADKKLWHP
jgi:hypothetical protein